MPYGGAGIEPFAGLAWVHTDTDAFSERGGAATLRGASADRNAGYSTLGLRVATSFVTPSGAVLSPRASVAWQHTFGDVIATQNLAFLSTGAGFSVSGAPLARDVAVVEAGLDWAISPAAHLGVFYTGTIGSDARDHAVKGKLTWSF